MLSWIEATQENIEKYFSIVPQKNTYGDPMKDTYGKPIMIILGKKDQNKNICDFRFSTTWGEIIADKPDYEFHFTDKGQVHIQRVYYSHQKLYEREWVAQITHFCTLRDLQEILPAFLPKKGMNYEI